MFRLLARLRNWLARLHRPRGVYYINGPETLPPPLTPEQEAKRVSSLKASWKIRKQREELRKHGIKIQ